MKFLHRLRFVPWLAIPLAAVWIWNPFDFSQLTARLAAFRLNPYHLLGLVIFNALVMATFNSRWWLILRSQGHNIPYFATFRYRMAAFAVSYFTPGTQFGGEPLQVYGLNARHGIPASEALASVTLDKLFELLSNFSFLAIGAILVLHNELQIGLSAAQLAVVGAVLILMPVGLLALFGLDRRPLTYLAARVEQHLPQRLTERWSLCKGLELIAGAEAEMALALQRRPVLILKAIGASILIWMGSLAEYWLALRVLGVSLSLSQTLLALTAVRLAFLTPLPGGIGALEAGQALAMQALGLSPMTGIAISLWIRIRDLGLGAIGAACGVVLTDGKRVQPLSPSAGD